MRINSIGAGYSVRNYGVQRQNNKNISFGEFENDKAARGLYRTLVENSPEDEKSKKKNKELYNFYEKTPLALVKERFGLIYAVLNRSVTDKHKNKELFDDAVDSGRWFAGGDDTVIDSGLLDIEPDFLALLGGGDAGDVNYQYNADELYDKLHDANRGYVREIQPSKDEYEKTPYEQACEDALYMRR